MPRYCFAVVITAADSANSVRDLFGLQAGVTGISDYLKGIEQDPDTGEFQRWQLSFGGNGLTVNGEVVEIKLLVAYVRDVSDAIRTRIGQALNARPMLGQQQDFAAGTTRQQIAARILATVGEVMACDHYWAVRPGDDLATGVTDAASLLAKFTAVPGAGG